MTIQQTILAFVPLIVLVFLIVVMARMVKVQPERRETLRNWGIVASGLALMIQIYEFIKK
jgi:hypothetical protein